MEIPIWFVLGAGLDRRVVAGFSQRSKIWKNAVRFLNLLEYMEYMEYMEL